MRRFYALTTFVPLAALWLAPPARAGDWPAFRGGDRGGVSAEAGVPLTWSAGKDGAVPQNIQWDVALPAAGNSSPVVWGDRVFLTCAQDARGSRRSLYCFDRADGKQRWVKTVAYEKADPTHARNPYCASSPAADEKRVYVWHGSAGLFCYDHDGNELWSRDLGVFRHIWGYASSPAVYGGALLLNCGPGERSFVCAVAGDTGQILWQTDEPGGAENKHPKTNKWLGSWATPVVARAAGGTKSSSPCRGASTPTTPRPARSSGRAGAPASWPTAT